MLVKPLKRLIVLILLLLALGYYLSTPSFRHELARRLHHDGTATVEDALGKALTPGHALLAALETNGNKNDNAIIEDAEAIVVGAADDDDDGDHDYDDDEDANTDTKESSAEGNTISINGEGGDDDIHDNSTPLADAIDYREIFSLETRDRKFIPIFMGGKPVYNPNIIPHPTRHDLWIIVAQHEQSGEDIAVSEQLTCSAGLLNGVLVCTAEPTILPIERSIPGTCEGDLAFFNFRSGPRDARMFYGPEAPYLVYGSQSAYTCLGIWLQDIRMLLLDFRLERWTLTKLFKKATEVHRPPPVKGVEKNFFLFWDGAGKAYAHHDIFPQRVFAQLSFDGSVGSDLAGLASNLDTVCTTKYMPTLAPQEESIHQATNSLAITLCNRSDPDCSPSDANTFIMTIFQHKSYHDYHGIYEPYVMLFQRNTPFAVHAISQRPLWIHGRGPLTKDTHSVLFDSDPGRDIPKGHSEMFYITSMSWKTHGQKYHGFLDDPMFLGFGIEDTRAAALDILAEDLVQDLGLCSH